MPADRQEAKPPRQRLIFDTAITGGNKMTHKKRVEQVEDLVNSQPADAEIVTEDSETSVEVESTPEETAETVRAELMERVLRLQADFDNYRRRTRQEQSELGSFVTQNLIRELLPVLDNFERALASRPVEDASGFGAGVEMIFRQFNGVLEKQGVTVVETVGSMFDPAKHEAIMRDEASDEADGTVVAELQKGYAVSGKVLRPALVKVAGK